MYTYKYMNEYIYIYIYISEYVQGAHDKFPHFFHMDI